MTDIGVNDTSEAYELRIQVAIVEGAGLSKLVPSVDHVINGVSRIIAISEIVQILYF